MLSVLVGYCIIFIVLEECLLKTCMGNPVHFSIKRKICGRYPYAFFLL